MHLILSLLHACELSSTDTKGTSGETLRLRGGGERRIYDFAFGKADGNRLPVCEDLSSGYKRTIHGLSKVDIKKRVHIPEERWCLE